MTLGLAGLLQALGDHGKRSGGFVSVLDFEPKGTPSGAGVTLALWLDPIDPLPEESGLNSTTVRVQVAGRVYRNMTAQPASDVVLARSVDAFMAAVSADFTLGGLAQCVDLLGKSGEPFRAVPGYLEVGHVLYRVIDLTIPIVVNDLWSQAP